jgi:hypothetical protein
MVAMQAATPTLMALTVSKERRRCRQMFRHAMRINKAKVGLHGKAPCAARV